MNPELSAPRAVLRMLPQDSRCRSQSVRVVAASVKNADNRHTTM
jgi:hypothetical protein